MEACRRGGRHLEKCVNPHLARAYRSLPYPALATLSNNPNHSTGLPAAPPLP